MKNHELFAVIDVGTNNVLFLMAYRTTDGIIIKKRLSSVSRMGHYISGGRLKSSGLKAIKSILRDYINYARLFTDAIIVVGTSGSRQITNIADISNWMEKNFGLRYQIISGEQEARYNGIANAAEFPAENILLFDIGGGSTEFTMMQGNTVTGWASLPLGIHRLDKEFGRNAIAKQDAINEILQEFSAPSLTDTTVIGVGGTITSLAAIHLGLKQYDSAVVHKSTLTLGQCQKILNRFSQMAPLQRRDALPFEPARADIIATGTMIVCQVLQHLGCNRCMVSDRGLQFGILALPDDEFTAFL